VPTVLVLNKIDLPEAVGNLPALQAAHPDALLISAAQGMGLRRLKEEMATRLQHVPAPRRGPQEAGDVQVEPQEGEG
jgi:50S ribosomal subunit-associated GTPase HflX